MAKNSTRARLLASARELVMAGGGRMPSAGAVASRAGVSRLTVYHHFGSHAGLLIALAESARPEAVPETSGDPTQRLRATIEAACTRWAMDAGLFRRLPVAAAGEASLARELALALAEADQLRPGCSLKEAEDVIALVTSFAAFDRLHQEGRRSPPAVAEILVRMASAILAPPSYP